MYKMLLSIAVVCLLTADQGMGPGRLGRRDGSKGPAH